MKNMILKTISALSLAVVSGMVFDFNHIFASIALYSAALAWLTIFGLANAEVFGNG